LSVGNDVTASGTYAMTLDTVTLSRETAVGKGYDTHGRLDATVPAYGNNTAAAVALHWEF